METSKEMEKDVVMKKYEMAFMVVPTLEEAAATEYFRALEKKMQDAGATISVPSRPQRITLAYEIKKNTEGYFGFVLFESGPAVAKSLDTAFRQEKNLLRHMMILNKYGEQPSITDQSVRRREPRPTPAASPAAPVATPSAPTPAPASSARGGHAVDNAELERRLEEILQ